MLKTIVVGVDDSEGAKEALQFAFDEAKLHRARLRVVHAWQYIYAGGLGFEGGFYPEVGELSELRGAAERTVEQTLRESLPDTDAVEIEQRVVEGPAAAVLVEESRDADLLVVGSRGRGGFAELLLGSVSHQVSHHAACPVVIVHPKKDGR